MPGFVFDGHWNFDLPFPWLLEQDYSVMKARYLPTSNLEKGTIRINIDHDVSEATDPTTGQLKMLDLLINQQDLFWERLLLVMREGVYPQWKGFMDDEEDDFPALENPEDLFKAIAPTRIHISSWDKEGEVYLTVDAAFTADHEHGLSVLMHKERMVDSGGQGDLDGRKLVEDLRQPYGDYEGFVTAMNKVRKEAPQPPFRPHAKYGMLKPNQAIANYELLYSLVSQNNLEKFAELFESYELDPNQKYYDWEEVIIELAVQQQRTDIVAYLLEAGAVPPQGILNKLSHGSPFNFALAELLLAAGADFNAGEQPYQRVLPQKLKELVGKGKQLYYDKEPNQEKQVALKKEVTELKKLIDWLISKGADPNDWDGKGNDLLHLYDQHCWADTVMDKIPFRNWVSKRVANSSSRENSPWWKFW